MPNPTLQTVVIIHPGEEVDTEELFAEACRRHPHGKIEQNTDGDILVMAPTGGESSHQNIEISHQLQTWAKRDGRGRAFDSNALFILPDKSKRSPDASWVSVEKLRKLPKRLQREFLPIVPDFVIELMSPSDRFRELQQKMQSYLHSGVELGWLIRPDKREVMIFRKSGAPSLLNDLDRVIGEPPVEGFVLEMADIWKGLDL